MRLLQSRREVLGVGSYRLNDDLSFCRIDGRLIFLDTIGDRYFRLSGTLANAFEAYVSGLEVSRENVAHLVERKILTDARPPMNSTTATAPIASRSALELPFNSAMDGIGAAAELFAILCRTKLQLRTRRLGKILEDAIARRPPEPRQERPVAERRLLSETHAFLNARRCIPIENNCLLDSLSLVMFLARRGLQADIVFGVTDDPFSAHCWVQSRDLVLNDALGNVRAYTVIRVVQ